MKRLLAAGSPCLVFSVRPPEGRAEQLADQLAALVDSQAEFRNRIRMISPSGHVSTVAGDGTSGVVTDGPALSAALRLPKDLKVGADGTVYFIDANTIRKLQGGYVTASFSTILNLPKSDRWTIKIKGRKKNDGVEAYVHTYTLTAIAISN